MDCATGAIGAVLSKLGMLLKEEYDLQKSVKDGIKFLMAELESMQVALEKVSQVPADQLDKQVKLWARDVREMSYDIEDSLDTFLVRVEEKKPAKPLSIKGLIDKSLNSLSKVKVRHRIAADIKDMKGRVKEAKERRDRYYVDSIVAKPATTSVDPRLAAMYKKANELVGIGETRGQIISMLNKGDDASVKSLNKRVSVVGVGGLGKTTLAKAVYDKVKVEFKCCAFVSVGQNPDVKKVLKDILLELDKETYKDIHNLMRDEKQLIDLLHAFLNKKRYLIVVDDVWDIDSWETIKLALIENNCGSTIITTTRKFEVGTEAGDVYRLEPLSHDNSRKLFYTRIVGGDRKCTDSQPDGALDKILKKCGGVPLAIITIASLLAGRPREEWSEVYSSIGFINKDNRHVENTMRILSFSYYDMPSHLRTCLLYLGAFPEDSIIYKDPLIWMWIAEGFVPRVLGVGQFELGERYFNELMSRSLMQPVATRHSLVGCRLHDMVLGLIRSLSREEGFLTIFDNKQDTFPQGSVRRLCYQNRDAKDNLKAQMDLTSVRSLIACACDVGKMVPLSGFHVLRVLALESCHFTEGYPLTHLGDLLHLRYLGLNNTKIRELPKEIGALKFLQTLDLEGTSIRELPLSVSQLTQLVRLRGSNLNTELPADGIIGKLTSLEELILDHHYFAGRDKYQRLFVRDLGNLTELRVLDASIGLLDESLEESLLESLRNLPKLRHLDICCNVQFETEERLQSRGLRWEVLGFLLPRHLQYLRLRDIKFPSLPTWINCSLLPNLFFLAVSVNSMDMKDLRVLGKLPELCCLVLWTNCNLVLYGGDGCFPKLRSCHLNSVSGDPGGTVIFRRGSCGEPVMPNLEYLFFAVSVRLLKNIMVCHSQSISCLLPTFIGLQNIPLLEEVFVRIDCSYATERDVDETHDTLWRAVSSHPNHPIFRIKRWADTEDDMITSDEDQQPNIFSLNVFEFHVHVRELNDMDYGFEFTNFGDLPSVEKVVAHINCEDATPEEVKKAEASLARAVDVHSNHPTLELERYYEDKMKLSCDQDQQVADHDVLTQEKNVDVVEGAAAAAEEEHEQEEAADEDVATKDEECEDAVPASAAEEEDNHGAMNS